MHTHVEGGVERNPRGDNFLLDGVTTVITGNCGGSELNLAAWFEKLGNWGWGSTWRRLSATIRCGAR